MSKVGNLINECDIIGNIPTLKLGSSSRNRTIIGGLLCIFIYALTLIGILYFGQELYFKKNPRVVKSSILIDENSDQTIIDENNFFFIFSIRDSNGNPINIQDSKNYFTVELTYEQINSNVQIQSEMSTKNMTSMIYNYQKCSQNNSIVDKNVLNFINFENWNCIINDQRRLFLNGGLSFNMFRFLRISIKKCTMTSGVKCKNNTEIDKLLSGATFSLIYEETFLDQRNYTTPAMKKAQLRKYVINPNLQTEIPFSIKRVEIWTDTGYMLEFFESQLNFQAEQSIPISSDINQSLNKDVLLSINFFQNEIKDIFYRKYYKLQNLLAEVGGLVKSFFMIAMILNFFHNESSYIEKMINGLFDVDDIYKYFQYYNPTNKQIFRKYRDSIFLRNTKNVDDVKRDFDSTAKNNFIQNEFHKLASTQIKQKGEHISNGSSTQKNGEPRQVSEGSSQSSNKHRELVKSMRKNSKVKERFDKVKTKRFSLNMFELMKFSCCCVKKNDNDYKNLIYRGGKETIDKKLDIIQVLMKMLEFDRFKNLMLKDYQLTLLNCLSKFMLDPERVNLVDFDNCSYDKMIDALAEAMESSSTLDKNLTSYIKSKYQIDTNFSNL
jgi:hypothetical protein